MIRAFLLLSCCVWSPGASATADFAISLEAIEAARPATVTLASIKASDTGVDVVAYAISSASIATYLRQLEEAGAVGVRMLNVRRMAACGRKVQRAEFAIDGAPRFLAANFTQAQPLNISAGDGNTFQCALPE